MQVRIDLYRLEVCALKSIIETVQAAAEALELPEDALFGSARVSVTAGRRTVVENHQGLSSYEDSRIEVRLKRGRLVIGGSGLRLVAMSADRLIIAGRIQTLEWE